MENEVRDILVGVFVKGMLERPTENIDVAVKELTTLIEKKEREAVEGFVVYFDTHRKDGPALDHWDYMETYLDGHTDDTPEDIRLIELTRRASSAGGKEHAKKYRAYLAEKQIRKEAIEGFVEKLSKKLYAYTSDITLKERKVVAWKDIKYLAEQEKDSGFTEGELHASGSQGKE